VGVSLVLGSIVPWILSLPMFSGAVPTQVNLETQVTGWSIVASFLVAAAVGLISGVYPAIVASRQDPIVALRHD
jgi:putative ABC transport system permease protein